jgi:hypothetical protein
MRLLPAKDARHPSLRGSPWLSAEFAFREPGIRHSIGSPKLRSGDRVGDR